MSDQSAMPAGRRQRRRNFLDRMAHGFVQAMEHALDAESTASRQGFLQGLDARVKLAGFLALMVSGVLTRHLSVLVALFLLALVLAFSSRISAARLYQQAWLGVLLFTGVIALPSIVLVPGLPVFQIPLTDLSVTLQGLRSAAFLIGRAETSATFALLLILSTPWTHVLKAMRCLGVPVVPVAILGMTYRYVFVFLLAATQLFEARRSRILAPIDGPQRRQMVTAAAGVLLGKAFLLGSEVHLAMLSRGYRGEVHLLDTFRTRPRDWFALLFALSLPVLILWLQR